MENNIFGFDYTTANLHNLDGTSSRSDWSAVYGEGGNLIHCKKGQYNLVPTAALSDVAAILQDKTGGNVAAFSHRNGEVIGLNVSFGERPSVVGQKMLSAVLTVPNNGGGKGYLSLAEKRLVCTNGLMRQIGTIGSSVKIPHDATYQQYLNIAQQTIVAFEQIAKMGEDQDNALAQQTIDTATLRAEIYNWFYHNELPPSEQERTPFANFRAQANGFAENSLKLSNQHRLARLQTSLNAELQHNDELSLPVSRYTVLAVATNYLSRMMEKSKTEAPNEVKLARESNKVGSLLAYAN